MVYSALTEHVVEGCCEDVEFWCGFSSVQINAPIGKAAKVVRSRENLRF